MSKCTWRPGIQAETDDDNELLSNEITTRYYGREKWEDKSMTEWDSNDYRLFCGSLGPEVENFLIALLLKSRGVFFYV